MPLRCPESIVLPPRLMRSPVPRLEPACWQSSALPDRRGWDVSLRLAQLSLSRDALDELLHVRSLLSLARPANVLEQEWSAVCSILTQVWKQRQWADWQLEERTQRVTPSQDFFQPLPVDLSQF